MTYRCDDVEILWIAGINEPPNIEQINDSCDYGQSWLIDLADPNGFCLLQRFTPTPGIPDIPHVNIVERLTVGYQASNEAVVIRRVRLDDHIHEVLEWHLKQWKNNSLWLYHKIAGESGLRRSLLYGVTPVDNLREVGRAGRPSTIHTQLSMDRHWCWETPQSENILFGERVIWSDVINPQYEIGTANGRICRFATRDLATQFTVDGDIISQMWFGIKEDNGCGLDQWMPAMDLLLGFTAFTDSNTNPGVSLGEPAMIEDFALSTARIKRIGIELFQAFPGLTAAQYNQWRGQYIVLLRCRVDDAGTIVTVQADSGWRTTRLKNYIGAPVTINGTEGTDYRLVQLGVATIPEDMHRLCANDTANPLATFDSLDNYSIGIEAGRDQGIGNLAMTDLYLIPYEHSAVISNLNPDTEFINFDGMWFNVINNEDDTAQLRTYTLRDVTGQFILSPDNDYGFDYNDFSLPKRGSRIVGAINVYDQDNDNIIHQKDFRWSPGMDVFPRWLSYRHDG